MNTYLSLIRVYIFFEFLCLLFSLQYRSWSVQYILNLSFLLFYNYFDSFSNFLWLNFSPQMLKSKFAGVTDFFVRSSIWILYSVMYAFFLSCVFHPSLGLEPQSPYLLGKHKTLMHLNWSLRDLDLFCLTANNFFMSVFLSFI